MRRAHPSSRWRVRGRRLVTGALVVATVILTACTAHSGTGGPTSTPASSAPSASSTPAPASGSKPNIVFVLTDDLAMNLVPYMPHVLALQHAGTSFSNYTVTDSLCCPSRSSIFSGKFPHDTGVFTNGGSDGGFATFHGRGEENSTFATALQAAGYRTAMMGKYLNGYQPADELGGSQPYVPPGWNEWDVAGNGYKEFNYDLNQNHQVMHYGQAASDYLTDVVGGKGTAFITAASAAHAPFLLEIATFAPHAPYTPAPQDANSFPGLTAPRGAAYDTLPSAAPPWLARRAPLTNAESANIDSSFRKRVQAVQAVDRMIASLEATLAKAGTAANTDIVFSSDNGYHMGEYRLTPGKMTAFDTDINVPLVIAGPGVAAGRVVSMPAQNIDLAPTFEALAGASTPSEVDGSSLLPLLRGQSDAGWRTASLVEHHGPDTTPADPDLPAKHSGNPPSYEALRTVAYTYVEYTDGSKEYYARANDPNELHNVVAQLPPASLSALHSDLMAMTACHGQAACTAAARLAR